MYDEEGLMQGGPVSSSAFSFTIHPAVVKDDIKLANAGGCERCGMDDGYFPEPREIVFRVLRDIARRIYEETGGGQLVPVKCKW